MKFYSSEIKKKFWKNVVKSTIDNCWIWMGSRNGKDKRARFYRGLLNGRRHYVSAARVAWEIDNKASILPGFFACHSCDNPGCVNPKHIWLGTPSENTIDAFNKGRRKYLKPINQGITQCKNGHPFSKENTKIRLNKDGSFNSRLCKTCNRLYQRKYWHNRVLFFCFFLIGCSSIALPSQPPQLKQRTLRLSLETVSLEYKYEVCNKKLIGICVSKKWVIDYYDLTKKEVRKELIDMGFVFKVRDPI